MRTHIYAPVGDRKFPGLVLYPEIFQQTGPIERLSKQFASHGYVVMAPEIFHEHEPPGTVLGYDDAGKDKGNAYKKTTKLSTFDNDARIVIDALRNHPQCNGRIGTVGFCIGGHPGLLRLLSDRPPLRLDRRRRKRRHARARQRNPRRADDHLGQTGSAHPRRGKVEGVSRPERSRLAIQLARGQRRARLHARRRRPLRRGDRARVHEHRAGYVPPRVVVNYRTSITSKSSSRLTRSTLRLLMVLTKLGRALVSNHAAEHQR